MTIKTTEVSVYTNSYRLIELDECCKTCKNIEGDIESGAVSFTCPNQNGVVRLNGYCLLWEENDG